MLEKKLQLHVIDAVKVAQAAGMGGRINAVMQACFFALSGVLPRDEAIDQIKKSIEKTYKKKGAEVVRRNHAAVDASLASLFPVKVPGKMTATRGRPPVVAPEAPDFVRRVTAVMLENKGDLLPVSAFPIDGTWPTATARWEKRNLALEIPVWDAPICIQCNKCALVCPHAAIRTKVYGEGAVATAPQGFKHMAFKGQAGSAYTVQVAPEDCTGCGLCIEVCPAKDKANPRHKALELAPQPPLREQEKKSFDFFLDLPEVDRTTLRLDVKGSQFLQPLFEFSGACSGCGETPYIKLLTQLFGDRMVIANATGCSSIYGGNLPTTPYTVNREGRGPAWANSLFEDNAEFGFGIRLGADALRHLAETVLKRQAPALGDAFVTALLDADQSTEAGIAAQRKRVAELKTRLKRDTADGPDAARPGRSSGEEERVDRRRRRLGLRHRVRRARPRPLDGRGREHPGARHRGVLEHRRPAVQGHAARGRGQVRRGRQVDREEGPRAPGDGLPHRLRGPGGVRGEGRADGEGAPGGRELPRPLAGHRLQPLHRPRLRPGERARAAEAGGGLRRPGRSTASTPGASPPGSRRWCSTRGRQRSR